MLGTYREFLEKVEELGFMAFSGKFAEGVPKLQDMTEEKQWHTGDPETDPWDWRIRAVTEKKLAFGCILGGCKGFVTKRMYPLFTAACRPDENMENRYASGEVSQTLYNVWKLFEGGRILSTADIRSEIGKRAGVSKIDSALAALQRGYLITVCGNKRKVGKDGLEYGWPANAYQPAEDWAGDWLPSKLPDKRDAREEILDCAEAIGNKIDQARLEKLLFGKL